MPKAQERLFPIKIPHLRLERFGDAQARASQQSEEGLIGEPSPGGAASQLSRRMEQVADLLVAIDVGTAHRMARAKLSSAGNLGPRSKRGPELGKPACDFQTAGLLVSAGLGGRLGPAYHEVDSQGANMSGFLGVLG